MSIEGTALVLAWVAITLLALAMAGILRQVHALALGSVGSASVIGLVPGSQAPLLEGEPWRQATAIFFADADCEACGKLLPVYSEYASQSHSKTEWVTVFSGAAKKDVASHAVRTVVHSPASFAAYKIPVTPFGVAVDERGIVLDARPLGNEEALHRFAQAAQEGALQ